MLLSANFDSPFYPFSKEKAENTLKGAEYIPYKLLMYFLDLPDANGYLPIDDNSRPRVRLLKYLWYDGEDPLSEPLPTPAQKRSLIFDPDTPVVNSDELKVQHPKGYRLLWQKVRGQVMTEAQTLIKCYLGRIFENEPFVTTIGIRFEIITNVNFETNTRTDAYARAFNIEQCIREALSGVNFAGIGTVTFSRRAHTDNGSYIIWDDAQNVGRSLHCSVSWAENSSGIDGGCGPAGRASPSLKRAVF